MNSLIKTARLLDKAFADKCVEVLFESHIVWMNEGRYTLQGFERVIEGGKVVDYARSWLCSIDAGMTK